MRSILILIKREIEDYAILYVIAAIASCAAAVSTYLGYGPLDPRSSHEMPRDVLDIMLLVVPSLAMLAALLGAIQMAGDRFMRISSFLVTLRPTRAQIFWAKWLAGLVWIMLGLLPMFMVHIYELTQRDLDASLTGALMLGSFLLLLACYGLGLQLGLMMRKSHALISALTVMIGLSMLLVIMGLGRDSYLLLLLVSTLSMARAWCRFKSFSL